jgi:hypothetical protein
MSAPTATPFEPLKRHWPGIAFVVLLIVLWWFFHSTKRLETNWQRNTTQLEGLALHASGGMLINIKTGTVETGDETGALEWHESTMEGLQFLQLRLRNNKETDWRACILYFIALHDHEPYYDDDVIHHRARRPRVEHQKENVLLTWILSRPVQSLKLTIPTSCSFQIEQITWAGVAASDYQAASWIFAAKILALGLELVLLALWIGRSFPRLHHQLLEGKCLSLSGVAALGILMTFLLPPFQGPDENKHWKAAIQKFRNDGQPGFILHDLPDLLEAELPRWRSENPYPVEALFSLAHRPHPEVVQESVGYAGPYAYPFIGLVALVFPSVGSVNEALIFYYLCRILALVCLCLLLGLLQKQLGISWLLMTFLSLPLVAQQCVIISTDTVPNLGTLAALYLFACMRSQQSWWTWAILLVITLAVIAAKPPVYLPLLVLPGWFLPWRKLLRGWTLLALTGALVVGFSVGYFVLWNILERTDPELVRRAKQQLTFVTTSEGISAFLIGAGDYPYNASNPLHWCTPLGWLDTDLSDNHLLLLGLSLGLAALLDLIRACHRPSQGIPHLLLSWLMPLAVIGIYFLFTWLSLALIMYLTISDYQQVGINGMQVRYLFPVLLFALIFPRTLVQRTELAQINGSISSLKATLLQLGQVLLMVLFVTRLIQLAIDLQYRYW